VIERGAAAPATTRAPTSWSALLSLLIKGAALTRSDTAWAMDEIMSGQATSAQLAAFAVLLRAKGETEQELAGLAETMLARAPRVAVTGRSVDLVGTGGDGAHTVNITTMAAVVVASTGRQLIKHGNRSASSLCGAADVLEALGVAIGLDAPGVARTVAEVGIGFCFAPVFHPGMRFAGPSRREIGVPTAFNLLGPLTNPARPAAAAIGCADRTRAPVLAQVLAGRRVDAMIFRGDDGLDELTTTTTSAVWLVRDGQVTPDELEPADLGLERSQPEDLRGGDAAHNARIFRDVLAGAPGPVRDAVLLNAAAGVAAFDAELGSAATALSHGLPIVRDAVDSGAAERTLNAWVDSSRRASGQS
jgi:anthranilate phosphoribosyltransferase